MKKALLYAVVALVVAACDNNGSSSPTDPSQVNIEFTTTDLVVGSGAEAVSGSRVTVNYTLWLYDAAGQASKGRQIQTSVGGKRRVYVPASLGYGASGSQDGSIPPNAALVFEIDLLSIQ